jgi:hypothetical protein
MNSRKTSVTAESIRGYKHLIKTATDDLEAHLDRIDEKLETIFSRAATDSETAERRQMQEDRLSTQQCLQICAQLSEHISQIQLRPKQRSEGSSMESEGYMQDVINRLIQFKAYVAPDELPDLERLREGPLRVGAWTSASKQITT